MVVPEHDAMGVQNAVALFKETFPGMKPEAAAAAPGRINLIGEHTDYEEGFVFPMALMKSTYVVGAKLMGETESISGRVISHVEVSETNKFKTNIVEIKNSCTVYNETDDRRWANSVIGMVALYRAEGYTVAPFVAALWSNVPLGAGVSSSAALEVAVGRFLEELNGFILEDTERARLARKCEHEYVGVNCGIMDQMISSGGRTGHALFIECSTPPKLELVPLNAEGVRVVVANSMQKHQLSGVGGGESWYNDRVKNCKDACAVLGVDVLKSATMEQLEEVRDKLPDHITYQRAKHVISENERTIKAKEAFRNGDLVTFGNLMYESHASLRDDYHVSSIGLDTLVEIARNVPGVYGSRMSGAGFGGCTVTLVNVDAVDNLIKALKDNYQSEMKILGETVPDPDVFQTEAGQGARALPLE